MENHKTVTRSSFFKQHWVFPILLVLLFLPVLVILPWQAQKIESEDRQQQLIADSLWVEQGIHFQLSRNEENCRFLGDVIIANSIPLDQLKKRVAKLIENNPELFQVVWLDEDDHVVFSSRPFAISDFSLYSRQSIIHARSSQIPQYSQPAAPDGEAHPILMDYHFPLFRHQRYIGSLVISYQTSAILEKMVPWWFAQETEISLLDIDDNVLADRGAGGYGRNVYTHNRSLDLPGVNLVLHTNSIRGAPRLLPNYLVTSVFLLGLGLLWTLWALWRDIQRRQMAESALRQQVAFRRAMENSLVTGLRVRNLEGQLVYVNPAFCEMVGFTQEQLVGAKPPLPYWAPEAIEGYHQSMAKIVSRTAAHGGFDTVYQHADGSRIPVLIYESPLVDEDGSQTGWMGSILNISDRKQAEQALRMHEEKLHSTARLSTMGELASVMAHELNQPLAAISSYAGGALSMMKSGELEQSMLESVLEKMQTQAQRAGQIIRSVHDFVVKREPTRTLVYLDKLFLSVLPLIELQAKSYLVTLRMEIEPSLPGVSADQILLEQVVLNLTRNAFQSMQSVPIELRLLRLRVICEDNQIQVEVIDRGLGITDAVAERLFSPFFSTKSEGMGMGLNICRTTIEFHGGQLTYRPNPAGGTIFCFSLPVHEAVSR